MKSKSVDNIQAATQSDHRPPEPSNRHSNSSIEQDLTRAVAAASDAASPPDWNFNTKPSASKSKRPIRMESLQAEPPAEEISRETVSDRGDDRIGKQQPFFVPPGAEIDHSGLDLVDLTKDAKALLRTGELIGWVNGLQRAAAYGITAGVSNNIVTYSVLGVTAVVQFCTAYASVAAGQASEKTFTGREQSNVESGTRDIIMSIREVFAISSQATAANNLEPHVKIPLTGAMTAVYGLMLLVDGVNELNRGYRNVKRISADNHEEYRLYTDKALMAKVMGIVIIFLLGGALIGSSFKWHKESQVRQWLFAAGAAVICSDLTGGLSFLGDHFKQKNRELQYGRTKKSWETTVYDTSMSVRSSLGLVTQIISLTAPNAVHHDEVTKVIGGVTNAVAAFSGIMRGYSYTGAARLHVRQGNSGINLKPKKTKEALDKFDKTVLGKVTGPLKKWQSRKVKTTGTSAARNVFPLGWKNIE
jgi:hypothetical protein